jgi:hypothetical protein
LDVEAFLVVLGAPSTLYAGYGLSKWSYRRATRLTSDSYSAFTVHFLCLVPAFVPFPPSTSDISARVH